MPIFTRRRLQAMLHDLAPCVDVSKLYDLRARLENKRVGQVLPAELELGVVWALSKGMRALLRSGSYRMRAWDRKKT